LAALKAQTKSKNSAAAKAYQALWAEIQQEIFNEQ
jgi:hypothetical protein